MVVSVWFSLTILGAAQSTQAVQSPFTITISTPRPVIKAWSPVMLKIVMTNTSEHAESYVVVAQKAHYDIVVTDEKGNPAPNTPYGQKIHRSNRSPLIGSSTMFRATLQPGEKRHSEVDISKEYDLSQPGNYTISAQDIQGGITVKSNTINVTITP